MHDFTLRVLTLAALCVASGPVIAADKDKPVPEGGAVQIVLLRQKSVRDALKLTDDEAGKIDTFARQQWAKAQKLEDASPDEQERKFDAMTKENERFLSQVLTPQQKKRLDEITLQVAGLVWLSRAEVESKLNLTGEQKAKVKLLQEEAKKEMQDVLHATGSEDKHEKLRELRKTNRKRLFEVLDDAQEAMWRELSGAPFQGDLRLDQ